MSHLMFALIVFTFLLKVSPKISVGDTFLAPKMHLELANLRRRKVYQCEMNTQDFSGQFKGIS